MTQEEAIKIFRIRKEYATLIKEDVLQEAIDLAIEALSAESNCKDCKKRNNTTFFMDDEKAIDIVIESLSTESNEHICKECQFYPIYCQMGAPAWNWKACEGFVPKDELAKMKGGAK